MRKGPQGPYHDPEFRAEVRRKLDAKVKELRAKGLSEAAIARQIGAKPQAFNKYLKGDATPRIEVVARACKEWGLRFSYRGMEIAAETFSHPPMTSSSPVPDQLTLPFEIPEEVRGDRIQMKVAATGEGTLNVSLQIKLAG
jgi:transcriptional regulator with XRE-family HTH domain